MRILMVTELAPSVRCVATVHGYVAAGNTLGHEMAVFGVPNPNFPKLPFTTDARRFDLALLVIQVTGDLPEMPYLAWLIDGIPRERRVLVDLWGRCNETIRVDHDFNHLEKLDGHQGWEWVEACQALAGHVVQPTLTPLRADVRSFLFHAYDPDVGSRDAESPAAAAAAWRRAAKPYGVVYVGNNWHRWDQLRLFLEQYARVRDEIGKVCLIGWDWDRRPQWAVEKGLKGIDLNPAFLADLGVEIRPGARFDETVGLLGQGRFAPVLHRPLFRRLGFVTNRSFETFRANALPVLMLPRDFVAAIYGPAALALVPGADVAEHLLDAVHHPEPYWDAVLQTRAHLARQHSYRRRFEELQALLEHDSVGSPATGRPGESWS